MNSTFLSITLTLTFTLILTVPTIADEAAAANPDSLLNLAHQEFDNADYGSALKYLDQALELAPETPDVHYYLGFYLHYLSYDSAPLTGYSTGTSDQVLEHLKKAIELDPENGNAKYFFGAEYGVRARHLLRYGDQALAVEEFKLGRAGGGYPDWLIEYGRNILRSCDKNAILFVNGDAETNAVEYLQCVENYRPDITAIPLALLSRPWFVIMLTQGLHDCLKPVDISWSRDQVMDMHPYKWQANAVSILVPESVRKTKGIDAESVDWIIKPDLGRGEALEYLSAGKAILVDILRTNNWKRPIHFSLGCPESTWEGLESHVQIKGLAHTLTPNQPGESLDMESTMALLTDETTFSSLGTLAHSDMPRVSNLLQNYRMLYMSLVFGYAQNGETETARELLESMQTSLPENILPIPDHYRSGLEAARKMLKTAN